MGQRPQRRNGDVFGGEEPRNSGGRHCLRSGTRVNLLPDFGKHDIFVGVGNMSAVECQQPFPAACRADTALFTRGTEKPLPCLQHTVPGV